MDFALRPVFALQSLLTWRQKYCRSLMEQTEMAVCPTPFSTCGSVREKEQRRLSTSPLPYISHLLPSCHAFHRNTGVTQYYIKSITKIVNWGIGITFVRFRNQQAKYTVKGLFPTFVHPANSHSVLFPNIVNIYRSKSKDNSLPNIFFFIY